MTEEVRHRLLVRQIRQRIPEELKDDPRLQSFIDEVNNAYQAADEDRALLERSLEESSRELFVANSELRAIFATLPDSLLTIDSSGIVIDAKGGELDSGIESQDLLGSNLTDFIIFEDPNALMRAISVACEKLVAYDGTLVARAPGNSNEYDVRIMPLARGTALAVATEVSLRRKHERELCEARDVAEEAVRAKSDFLATMSHEIRTPLNGVIGMTGLLLETQLEEEQREFLDIVMKSGETLLTLINEILDFSKIEADCLELEVSPFSPEDIVEDTLELLSESAGSKGIDLSAVVENDVPREVKGDAGRLQQILLNIVGNAIKFTERGSVVLNLGTQLLGDKVVLEFSIKDTGIGISESAQERLFDPFTQADSSTTREFGGTGLGLAICHKLIALMGGSIRVESTLGEGACFRFEINAMKIDDTAPIVEGEKVLNGRSAIYLYEEGVSKSSIEHQLRPHMSEVHSVLIGPQTWGTIENLQEGFFSYDLWILDIDLRKKRSVEFVRKIRELAEENGAPILVLCSVKDSVVAARAKELGINTILRKPVRRRNLLRRIEKLLNEKKPTTSTQTHPEAKASPVLEERLPRVLIAEDNPINQRVAKVMLERLGCRPHVVANGIEALDAAQSAHFDAILMDCQMPEMDGIEATRILREKEEGDEKVLIIALTANTQENIRTECLEVGMDGYLSKPVQIDGLRSMLIELRVIKDLSAHPAPRNWD